MKSITYSIAILLLATTIFSCLQPPDYPDEPVIEFIGFNKDIIAQGSSEANKDVLTISLSYTDGDGDLSNEKGEFDIFLEDTRDEVLVPPFRLPVIPEQGTGNGISGEIYLNMDNTPLGLCCIFDDKNRQDACTPSIEYPTDTLTFTIFIVDRAGHVSNKVETTPLILECK